MGRIAPRYWTTSRLPTFSTLSRRTCSRRVTVSSGIATRRPPPIAASSIRCRSLSPAAAAAAASRDSCRSVAVVPVARQVEHVGEADQRQQLAAQPVDRRAADLLDRRGGLLGVEGDQLL